MCPKISFKRENDFQEFTFLLLKRRWIQKLVFEDGGVQNISRIKIYRTLIIYNGSEKFAFVSAFDCMNKGDFFLIIIYCCPVNVFKSFKIQYLSNYKPQFFIITNLSQ